MSKRPGLHRDGRLCAHLPRAALASLPTRLEDAPRLSAALGARILIKRDDLSGLCAGGNKSRLLELVIGRLAADGTDTLIACAAPQSNKLREMAAAAARSGMRAVLLMQGVEQPGVLQGNRLLCDLLGAEVRAVAPERDALDAQREVAEELAAAGGRPAILDRRCEYGLLATLAYVDAAEELLGQLRERDVTPDRIFITAGAGMTLAGLVLGLAHRGLTHRVTGVCVAQDAQALAPEVVEYAGRASRALGLDTVIDAGDFALDDDHRGAGYASVDDAVRDTVRFVATHHGMVVDPVYNARTMHALIEHARRPGAPAGETLVVFNTGGGPALFEYAAEMIID